MNCCKDSVEADLKSGFPADALEVLMTRCEALQARKISQRSKSESEATPPPEITENKTQPPVSVSVNGKNITLFGNNGNQM